MKPVHTNRALSCVRKDNYVVPFRLINKALDSSGHFICCLSEEGIITALFASDMFIIKVELFQFGNNHLLVILTRHSNFYPPKWMTEILLLISSHDKQ